MRLLFLEHWITFKHPFIKLFEESPTTLIGDDIELGNRMLSQCTKSDSRRSQPDWLNRTYQALGLMSHCGMDFFDETEELKTYSKGPRRYTFKDPDATIQQGIEFFRN